MKTVIGILTALVVWGGAGMAAADQMHTARGKVVAADRGGVTMVLENGHRHVLDLARTTTVYDEFDQPSALPLQPGDFVEEDCVSLPNGHFLARRITLLRAAWREINSPGY
jgi:hypothetical protein